MTILEWLQVTSFCFWICADIIWNVYNCPNQMGRYSQIFKVLHTENGCIWDSSWGWMYRLCCIKSNQDLVRTNPLQSFIKADLLYGVPLIQNVGMDWITINIPVKLPRRLWMHMYPGHWHASIHVVAIGHGFCAWQSFPIYKDRIRILYSIQNFEVTFMLSKNWILTRNL